MGLSASHLAVSTRAWPGIGSWGIEGHPWWNAHPHRVSCWVRIICRQYVPVTTTKWADVRAEDKEVMLRRLQDKFNIDYTRPGFREHVLGIFGGVHREWRYQLHLKYKEMVKNHGVANVREHIPADVSAADWPIFCDRFASPEFQTKRETNKANKAKQPYNQSKGRKPFVQYRAERGNTNRIDFFKDTHYVPGKGPDDPGHWSSPAAEAMHVRMTEIHTQQS